MTSDRLRLYSGNSNPRLASRIAEELALPLGQVYARKFSDGEISVQIEESVRGLDTFLVQSTCHPVNDNLVELLIMIDAFRRASARRITVVIPYYGYARQDKKLKPREPVTARLVADLITQAGATRVLCVDLHAGQIQAFFNIPVDHLLAGPLIAERLLARGLYDGNTVVVSPDVGGVPRARVLAERLGAPIAIIAKRRPEVNQVEVMEIIGDVKGRTCVMVDDMIDTGGSIVQGANALIERGATAVHACCTHAVLSGEAVRRVEDSALSSLTVTDTIPLPATKRADKIEVISVAGLLADAIRRIHTDSSVSELFASYVNQRGRERART